MIVNEQNSIKSSLVLYELSDKLFFLTNLLKKKKFPKVLMLSGKKGIGKSTLINHFITYVYDHSNYDLKNNIINNQTTFYKQYLNNTFLDVIYLEGLSYKSVKIDDIRNIKSTLLKSSLSEKNRFVILNDVELFNTNSLNALLKIIEEPSANNFFILINNQTKPLIRTIHSRSIEVKISLSNFKRESIIKTLIKKRNIETHLDYKTPDLTPGNYLLFNDICIKNSIDINDDYVEVLKKLLFLYKKNKELNVINFILFLTDCYFYKLYKNKDSSIDKIYDNKTHVINNINKFVTYNLNQNTLINSINNKLSNG